MSYWVSMQSDRQRAKITIRGISEMLVGSNARYVLSLKAW